MQKILLEFDITNIREETPSAVDFKWLGFNKIIQKSSRICNYRYRALSQKCKLDDDYKTKINTLFLYIYYLFIYLFIFNKLKADDRRKTQLARNK